LRMLWERQTVCWCFLEAWRNISQEVQEYNSAWL
jgi:hypothetical protein